MTERKPLTLSIPSKELQERRAQAMRVLSEAGSRDKPTDAVATPDAVSAPKPYSPNANTSPEPVLLRRRRTIIVNPSGVVTPTFPPMEQATTAPTPSRFSTSTGAVAASPVATAMPTPPLMPVLPVVPLMPAVPIAKPPIIERPPLPERMRLNRRMADMGLCSRREADAWIAKGWVRVNGETAITGQQVHISDKIDVAVEAQIEQEQQVTILLNKPVGYVSGQAEDGYPPAVSLITPRHRWSGDTGRMRFNFKQLQGIAPAGRLDIDSVGLLVLTQDGRVARQLIGEDSQVEKEYLVRVAYVTPTGSLVQHRVQNYFPPERLDLLRHGLSLDGEPLKPAQINWQNPDQLRFVLTEGKKRQIRRMCELVGLTVVGLKRIRIGGVMLGNLPPGQWRYLGSHERF